MPFLDDHFLLGCDAAKQLFTEYAKDQPILDFHSHLSAEDIANDRQFQNLFEAWLEEDHYKWRAMRANGIKEAFITGNAPPREKFDAWATTVPMTLRNPLYHWTHLELRRYFDIEELLNPKSAGRIWENTANLLQSRELSVQSILNQFDVRVVCTTDDPAEPLDAHHKVAAANIGTRVFPTFRPDKAGRVDCPEVLTPWLHKLGDITGIQIDELDDLLSALKKRHDDFHEIGGRLSDHDLPRCFGESVNRNEAAQIFKAAIKGQPATDNEFLKFGSFLIVFLGQLDAEKGWTKQMHIGAFRNTNSRGMNELGPDAGFDSVGDLSHGEPLRAMLDNMELANALPKTVLYNLNPADNFLFGTMCGNFQREIPGKMQLGSGWWFLDQHEGIQWQLNTLSNLGLLSHFIGMVTDSRSFLSFPRHEYFRRVLCDVLGRDMESGLLPDDMGLVGSLVSRICYSNAIDFLAFPEVVASDPSPQSP